MFFCFTLVNSLISLYLEKHPFSPTLTNLDLSCNVCKGFGTKTLIPDFLGTAWKSGVDQKINNLTNSMTFRPDKELKWKMFIFESKMSIQKERNQSQKIWPEKGLFFGCILIQADEVKLFCFYIKLFILLKNI